ncbi:MAG: hypothetical protein WB628_06695 [Candidatus Sulfotelmatobacter sp.]
MSLRRFNLETGKTLYQDDRTKPYVLRQPVGLPLASVRRFQRGKPRYRRYRGLLVMTRRVHPRRITHLD